MKKIISLIGDRDRDIKKTNRNSKKSSQEDQKKAERTSIKNNNR
jgi:hypothetical protein